MSDAFSEPPPTPAAESTAWAGSEAVYASAYRDLLRVAFVLTGSAAAAEDAVHDVFAKVGPRIDRLIEPAAYLRVAVVNRCRSLHRRTVAAPTSDRAIGAVMDVGLVELRDALMALPIRQRSAIVLRYVCDLPEDEIAASLKCRRSTVRTLVRRGLAELREVIR
ncbi:MAG: sigma factor-like helix-turn-helix DNA-binding protein [Ilumatobacteraceae bacterium]